jgi:hypothetical protein
MTIAILTPEEREVVRRTMLATFRYFDFDFHTRLGISPETMRILLATWPAIDDASDLSDACVAVNNSFNDLLYGVGISEAESLEFVGVKRAEMARIYSKWANARGWHTTGVR